MVHPNCFGGLPANETTIAGVLSGQAGYDSIAVAKLRLGRSPAPSDRRMNRYPILTAVVPLD